MSQRFAPSQILKTLRSGPGRGEPPTAHQVKIASKKYPPQYGRALVTLLYRMVDEQMRNINENVARRYQRFSDSWRGTLSDNLTRFYFASLDAYVTAVQAGLQKLDHSTVNEAHTVATTLTPKLPPGDSIEGLAWRTLLGQIQSVYSRDSAAKTFAEVRQHPNVSLISSFYRDTGALTYFSQQEIEKRKRPLPSLSQMSTWDFDHGATAPHAMVVSVDPNFFRIYGPMLLFNAQQLPELDFAIVVCAPQQDAAALRADMWEYMRGLARFNKQSIPQNVRIIGAETPSWVSNEMTFYASARFLAVPQLLEQYSNLYVMDADLFLTSDPAAYLIKHQHLEIAVPLTKGPAGICPWRRHMAGSLVARKEALSGTFLPRLLEYLSVGLSESKSWMLDQNALSYAVDGSSNYVPLPRDTPVKTSSIMGRWERNYRLSTQL